MESLAFTQKKEQKGLGLELTMGLSGKELNQVSQYSVWLLDLAKDKDVA